MSMQSKNQNSSQFKRPKNTQVSADKVCSCSRNRACNGASSALTFHYWCCDVSAYRTNLAFSSPEPDFSPAVLKPRLMILSAWLGRRVPLSNRSNPLKPGTQICQSWAKGNQTKTWHKPLFVDLKSGSMSQTGPNLCKPSPGQDLSALGPVGCR